MARDESAESHVHNHVEGSLQEEVVNDAVASHMHPRTDDTNLLHILDRKRKDLDREIRQFHALKDREFRLFETWLRRRASKVDINIMSRRKEVDSSLPFALMSDASHSSWPPTWRMVRPPDWPDTCTRKVVEESDDVDAASKDHGNGHDREAEFQGVFTPGFLSLLSRREPAHVEGSTISNETPEHSNAQPTPLTIHALSSTLPDAESGHRRSSSAGGRSDSSIASLRSSLKDPNAPRSPKRVMFDIDDTVVAPTSSPGLVEQGSDVPAVVMSHTASSRGRMPKKKTRDRDRAGDKFEIIKRKPPKSFKMASQHQEDERQEAAAAVAAATGAMHAAAVATTTPSSRRRISLLRTGLAQSAPEKASNHHLGNSSVHMRAAEKPSVDGFETVSIQDGMFDFEDDLDQSRPVNLDKKMDIHMWSASRHSDEIRQGWYYGADDHDNEAEENQKSSSAAVPVVTRSIRTSTTRARGGEGDDDNTILTASSPHAGSLPIEIENPGRRAAFENSL